MKKKYILLTAVFSFIQITAQQGLSPELVELTKRVNKLRPTDKILTEFNLSINNFTEKKDKVLFNENFVVSNENDVLRMFGSVMKAREEGLVAQNIWDNYGIGIIIKDKVHLDGRINTYDFIGELPGNTGPDTNIGSEFGGKNSKRVSGTKQSEDLMNPGGDINGNSGYMGDGLGSNYKNGTNGNGYTTNNTGDSPNESGGYGGQLGNDKGDSFADSSGANTSGSSQNEANATWSVEATHSNHKNSGSGGFSSFIHHQESVSNDQGYSSTTDKQSFTGTNGTTTTRVVVTQTQSDGSSKTVATTTTTDADGNSNTTRITTEKDENGEVTNQEKTESNNPPKEGDDNSCERPDDGSYDDRSNPPNDAEKESAVWRAVVISGLYGGSGDDRTGNSDKGEMSSAVSPQDLQNQEGYMEEKTKGGKINKNKMFKKEQVIKTKKQ